MNHRAQLVALVLSLSACDWNDAERRARCVRAPSTPGCGGEVVDAGHDAGVDGGDDAGVDGGGDDAGVDGGGGDAGIPDAGRSVTLPSTGPGTVDPIGLYPASDGGVWLVANLSDRGVVQLRDVYGRLVHDFSFDGGSVVSAYGNGAVHPSLAVLREDTGQRSLWLVREDGTEVPAVARDGTRVSMYVSNGEHRISVWNAGVTTLSQHIYDLGLTELAGPTSSACTVQLVDLEVEPPSRTGSVAIPYSANLCDGSNVAMGITAMQSGVQTITPDGTRRAADAGAVIRVGGSVDGQLRLISQADFGNLTIGAGVWSSEVLTSQPQAYVGATGGIVAGDISDRFITFRAEGDVFGSPVSPPAVTCLCPEASIASVAPWGRRTLGAAIDFRLPVLHSADNVWVLWAPLDGGLQLSNFAPDLTPR